MLLDAVGDLYLQSTRSNDVSCLSNWAAHSYQRHHPLYLMQAASTSKQSRCTLCSIQTVAQAVIANSRGIAQP